MNTLSIIVATLPSLAVFAGGIYLINRVLNNHLGGLDEFMDNSVDALREIVVELKRLNK